MKISKRDFRIEASRLEDVDTIDVRFDGHRVWSVQVPSGTTDLVSFAWPKALRERLTGVTHMSVDDTTTGDVIDEGDHRFGRSRRRLAITDGRGRWLAMTKWNRLGPVLEGREDDVAAQLLEHARELVAHLVEDGHNVYMVGGTLLGIIREGGMLPHDDDVDLAYLSPHSDPISVGLESYKMERALSARGYTVVRHSLTHLEVEYFNERGQPDHYVDIFTGFFRDGNYNQPFALRGPEVVPDDLLPTRSRVVDGVELPEPADPEAWLAFAYGENWRVPDPTFKFVSPRSTLNRFETWFGVFNRGRVYWDKRYLEMDEAVGFAPGEVAVDAFLRAVPPDARILDFGCGDGRWSRRLHAAGHRVTAIDYSHEALRIARGDDDGGGVDFRYVNANDRAALLELGAWMIGTGDEWCVFAHHSVQALTKVNRQNFLLFLDLTLRGRGFADVVSDIDFSRAYQRGKPSTWHLPTEWLLEEAARHPLNLDLLREEQRQDGRQKRATHAVRIRRTSGRVVAGDNIGRRTHTAARREEEL